MKFALICIDKPGHIETRKANRNAHLAYLAETGCVVQAGPFISDEGEMEGSLLILELADRAAATAWAANDPYARAGLFANVYIRQWREVALGQGASS